MWKNRPESMDFNYLLVSDSVTEQEAEAYILKDVSEPESQEACYVMVEDEQELEAVMRIFEQSMEDVDIKM